MSRLELDMMPIPDILSLLRKIAADDVWTRYKLGCLLLGDEIQLGKSTGASCDGSGLSTTKSLRLPQTMVDQVAGLALLKDIVIHSSKEKYTVLAWERLSELFLDIDEHAELTPQDAALFMMAALLAKMVEHSIDGQADFEEILLEISNRVSVPISDSVLSMLDHMGLWNIVAPHLKTAELPPSPSLPAPPRPSDNGGS